MSSPTAPGSETSLMPLDTQLLLALLDLKTERIIAEAEAIVISYANREAQLASAKDMRYD